jgi:hypothetical protein
MSDTPETDDIARGNHVVPTEWAQQLERERDEAREERDKLKQLLAADSENVDAYLGVCIERDEAREVLKRIAHASMSARHKEEDYAEWEKAVESLQGICEEKNFINE